MFWHVAEIALAETVVLVEPLEFEAAAAPHAAVRSERAINDAPVPTPRCQRPPRAGGSPPTFRSFVLVNIIVLRELSANSRYASIK
jgi:hypothetical protein